MTTGDIAEKFNLDQKDFEKFLEERYPELIQRGFRGISIDDAVNMRVLVSAYRGHQSEKELEQEEEQEEARRKRKAIGAMLITSGFHFDGYTIKKYSGYISGDAAVSVARGVSGKFYKATNAGGSLMEALTKIRREALQKLKEAAYDLGCNAVIGVDFDYITLEPETANISGGTTYLPYVFGVTANGNAVIIEKDEDSAENVRVKALESRIDMLIQTMQQMMNMRK